MGDIMLYNGGAVVAMVGSGCVGIACDKRLGINKQVTISSNFPKIFKATDTSFFAACGLATDIQTLKQEVDFRVNMYELHNERQMGVKTLSQMVSAMLYSKRFGPYFVEPIVAGLDSQNNPHITCYDFVGASCSANDFVVVGSCSEQLYGICEALYKPNMGPEELFETLSQCLLSAVDRDCLSGWGALVYIITPKQVISRSIKCRMD